MDAAQEQLIRSRVEARRLAAETAALANDEAEQLDDEGKLVFWAALLLECRKHVPQHEPEPVKEEQPKPRRVQMEDWEQAIEQCETILELCEKVPERGSEYADDVAESVAGVQETIEEAERVTERQLSALKSWEAGIRKWIR